MPRACAVLHAAVYCIRFYSVDSPLMHFLRRALGRARRAQPSSESNPQHIEGATQSQFPSKATIGKLSDKLILKISVYFLDGSPRHWPCLVHICRRWRRIVFASQQALYLRVFCTSGSPVQKNLDCWPASLPVVLEYGGLPGLDPPAPEDEKDVMAALKQSDRVISISLTITSSLQEKLSAIERRFSKLEALVLLSQDGVQQTLPSAFQLGPRLRRLHSTRVTIPALVHQLLFSSKNLVDLHLHEVLDPSHFPPEALTMAFSGLAQLRSLSLQFLCTGNHLTPPIPTGELVVLPVLLRLNFQGSTEYLESLVAKLDAPVLGDIEVTFFNLSQPNFDFPRLREFTKRIGVHKSHRRADILSSEGAISVSLTRPGYHTNLKFQLCCKPLNEQLSFIDQICIYFYSFLHKVEDLRINAMQPSSGNDDSDRRQWRDIIYSFRGVKWFHIAGDQSAIVVRALLPPDGRRNMVPTSLIKLYTPQPEPHDVRLREAVVSCMTSRRLSGHPIGVEYERVCHISEFHGTGPFSRRTTTEMLPEDILLNIFRHYIGASPLIWPILGWVCQKWRQIVFTSPLGLNLRLYCTYGTPVLKSLDCWPSIPIIVKYGGVPNLDPPAPQDDDNIIVALKQSRRVNSISLTVTRPLLEKLSAISEPFSELEELALLSLDNMQPDLPSTFRWGPLLRTLQATKIAFPSFPQLLLPSQGLVDIQLHEIPSSGYFPPEAFANAMSGMTHLRTLSFHFLSLPPRRKFLHLPPQPWGRTVLPSLTCLKYRGTSKYLDSFVARIDAPLLGDIDITFFFQPTMDASQLGRFIERIETQLLLRQAEVKTSAQAISISFTNSSASTAPFQLQISCKQSDWQLSSLTQVCDQFSSSLLRVEDLSINTSLSSSEQNDVAGEQWLRLVHSFNGARNLRVADKFPTNVLCALGRANEGDVNALPALYRLHVDHPVDMNEPSLDAFLSFISSRSLSGRPVQVTNLPLSQCQICLTCFMQQKGLDHHLEDNHAYRPMCSHCGGFEWAPGHNDLFREHLEIEHPEATSSDAFIWSPLVASLLTPSQLESHLRQHSSPRAPGIVAPFPMVTAPHSQSLRIPTPEP